MSFKRQMLLLLASVGLIPMLVVAGCMIWVATTEMQSQSFAKLGAVREIKSAALTGYLDRLTNEVELLSVDPELRRTLKGFDHAYQTASPSQATIEQDKLLLLDFYQKEFIPRLKINRPDINSNYARELISQLNNKDIWFQYRYLVANPHPVGQKDKLQFSGVNDEYDQYHQQVQNYLQAIQAKYGFYDVFLINSQGEVLYSVFKEIDYATSLTNGPFKQSGLADAFRAANQLSTKNVIMVDLKNYIPSYDVPAGFIAAPIFDDQGLRVGVIAAQFPIASLNNLINQRKGMGQTGETLLVGPDRLVRNDSYLHPERYSVQLSFLHPEKSMLKTASIDRALAGETGEAILPDYTGHDVLAAYAPYKYKGLNWALLVKMNKKEALAASYHLWYIGAVIIVISMIVVIICAVVFTHRILKPLGAEPALMQRIAQAVADGDLTIAVPDANAQSVMGTLSMMKTSLRDMVAEITQQTHQQHLIAQELASASEQTNQALHDQASHTSMVATSVVQMTESFREVSENIQHAAAASNQSKEQIEESTAEVVEASNSLHDVADDFKNSAKTVDELTNHVAKIASVLESIQSIADQTNLLALNAAIEAARAGENGRGFAVVADEVRSLALNTQRETEQISEIIQSLKNSSSSTQQQMHVCVEQAEKVCEESNLTAKKLRAAATSLEEVAQMNETIASASEEQSHVVTDISASVESLSSSITQSEQAMNEIARSSSLIASSSNELQNLIKNFRV
ncbi:methyl-accepting chemotaxis protein [Celerinatantimonas yamalensis]|uniref:Methyl-accepting chemotaxis protein n=1 Tax=Celerinatantimonas yamalensis TaxID=559956 RepID=A0ABW9GBP1_9GAMM